MARVAGSSTPCRGSSRLATNTAAFGVLLTEALNNAIHDLDAIAGVVYLMEDTDNDGEWLHAAMFAGTPPAMFTMPERMVSLVVVYGISGWECAGVCPGRTSTGECRSLNMGRATA